MARRRSVAPPRTPEERTLWQVFRELRAAQAQHEDWRGDEATKARLLARRQELEALVDAILLDEPPDWQAVERFAARWRGRVGEFTGPE